jgi:hypothetical protein
VRQPAHGQLRVEGQDVFTAAALAQGLLGHTVVLGVRPENPSLNPVAANGDHPHRDLPRIGEQVTVRFPREACLVLQGSGPVAN